MITKVRLAGWSSAWSSSQLAESSFQQLAACLAAQAVGLVALIAALTDHLVKQLSCLPVSLTGFGNNVTGQNHR
jgi:hypothetical protein